MTLSYLPLAFPALMAFAASYDSLVRRISNLLCLMLALAFVPAALAAGLGGADMLSHLSCGLAMLALGCGVFAMGWAGGGDAKLFAAAALWLGWGDLGAFAALTAISGGALAVGFLLWRLARLHLRPDAASPSEMPYGVALAAGALLTYPHSLWAAV